MIRMRFHIMEKSRLLDCWISQQTRFWADKRQLTKIRRAYLWFLTWSLSGYAILRNTYQTETIKISSVRSVFLSRRILLTFCAGRSIYALLSGSVHKHKKVSRLNVCYERTGLCDKERISGELYRHIVMGPWFSPKQYGLRCTKGN